MPLPSQNVSTSYRRAHMYRRARPRRRRKLVFLIFVVALAGGFWLARPLLSPADDLDSPAATGGDDQPQNSVLARNEDRFVDQQVPQPTSTARNDRSENRSNSNRQPDPPPVEKLTMGATNPAGTDRTSEPASTPKSTSSSSRPETTGSSRPATASNNSGDITGESANRARARMQQGLDLIDRNELVEGRWRLTQALVSGDLPLQERQQVRDILQQVNQRMVFSPQVIPGDPFAYSYTIKSGDVLETIVRREGAKVDWRLIQRINNIDPRRIWPGQKIKLITGPFHAVVDKSDYRLDVFLGESSNFVYVCSFPVGLGEFNTTPTGLFSISSRLTNPEWVNPRTRQLYKANDPKNPIGEHWLGLEGVDEAVRDVRGYGIHGTIEPQSIGTQSSMGCVRLKPADIEVLYEMLVSKHSTVEIRP